MVLQPIFVLKVNPKGDKMFRCKHKFGKVEKDGYQYCEKCGKATKPECQHKWKIINEFQMQTSLYTTSYTEYYHLQCEKCGEIKIKST